MKGNVGEIVCRFWGHKPDRYAGVYSFKDRERAQSEFNSGVIELKRYPTHADYNTVGLALGSVKLWGEIVEHEYGYRASFAKPASLDEIYYYGVPTTDPKGLYF
jgi:hypothetical protein